MSDPVRSYRDLRVWQTAMDIAEGCYLVTKNFPKDEMYGMVSQVRRSAASIAANIAEGYGRDSSGSYANFLRIAQGSLKELETHLVLSVRVELATKDLLDPLLEKCDVLGRMLRSLIRSIEGSGERQPT
jgi:four helix bundle protein